RVCGTIWTRNSAGGDSMAYWDDESPYESVRREEYRLSGRCWQEEPTFMGVPIQPRDPYDDPVWREYCEMMEQEISDETDE
ncbi:MAG: hypothetical protein ACPLRU_09010, partial [Desulfofundulus sp.]